MLSIARVKEILGKPSLSDEVAERIRDECDAWAALVLDAMEYSGSDWENEDWYKKQPNADGGLLERNGYDRNT